MEDKVESLNSAQLYHYDRGSGVPDPEHSQQLSSQKKLKGGGASGFGIYLNAHQQKESSPEDLSRNAIADNIDGDDDEDAMPLRTNNTIKQLRQQKPTQSMIQEKIIPSQPLHDNLIQAQDPSQQKPRTSGPETQKFRKKGISEYLKDYDGSGSNSRDQEDLIKSGQNVMVAPKREIVLDFHPKGSTASEKLNDPQSLYKQGAIETPKTAGLRQVQPFQLSVPGMEESAEKVGSFKPSNPSDATGSNQLRLRIPEAKKASSDLKQNTLNKPRIEENKSNEGDMGDVADGEGAGADAEEELQKMREQELLDQMKTEKHYYKLADYFVTIGIDNYQSTDEVYKQDESRPSVGSTAAASSTPSEAESGARVSSQTADMNSEQLTQAVVDQSRQQQKQDLRNAVEDFKIIEDEETGLQWNRIIKSLEILVIQDQSVFETGVTVNGMKTNVVHPSLIDEPNEKWIDLRGDQLIYLKVTYDDVKNVKRPISDLNFYKISKFHGGQGGSSGTHQKSNKMQIHVRQGIEPIPVKVFGDPDAEKKIHKTKKLGKNGNKNDDMYNFYGDYDLTSYFEEQEQADQQVQKKNLCLCVSTKKSAPVQDLILVIGQQIPNAQGRTQDGQISTNMTINWDVPEGYKKLAYSVGTRNVLNRLLCLKTRDLTKQKIKAKVLDRYPPEGQDRHYYPFPVSIGDFCFPSGIGLKYQSGSPEFFNFNLTDANGVYIYGSCLIFDEDPSKALKEKLKSYHVRNISTVRTIKAICILSHYSFNAAFKDILCQLYRMQLSNSRLHLPIERYVVNIIDEIPLPDEGKILIQHELRDKTASFFRPVDQNPPIIEEMDVENLFKCLSVDNIIEIFSYLLLERKVLFISEHKALLTQVINCFNSFLFPFQWKHTMIPILPNAMTDILEAPFPYLIGIEPTPKLDQLDIESEVLCVYLDKSDIKLPVDMLQQSQMPQLPFKEYRQLKQRLVKASEHILRFPDEQMLLTVDLAFNNMFIDPEENETINHLEVRDAFLEFLTSIMSGFTKYLKDLSEHYDTITNITNAKECFDMTGFRLQKDAKKPYTFIYKFTETTHFAYFIECRALGQTEYDQQIIFFEKILQQKRNLMNPRLIFPFAEQKSIKSMQPNEEGLNPDETWGYKIWPMLDPQQIIEPRPVPDYNKDSIYQQVMGSLIRPEDLSKMHDDEFARYMVEVLVLLWYQVFCTTLPIYSAYAPQLIEFARRFLVHIKSKIKPMRDVEFIYRRLFESCGTCKQTKELLELNKEMKKSKIQPDKVTSGTFYQAMLECKRRGGAKEDETEKRRSYFARRIEDYQDKLSQNCGDDEYVDQNNTKFRFSNISLGQKGEPDAPNPKGRTPVGKAFMSPQPSEVFDQPQGVVDFQDLLSNQQTAAETRPQNERSSNPAKLSSILENSLFLDIQKQCSKCQETLREEELFSGFQKSLSEYTVRCPICKGQFVPKFTVYCEQENTYLNGRKGTKISLLPPISLYKEFFNILMKEGEQILMSENFIINHKITFWNMVLYFKILKLPLFMLDLDFSPHHQRVHCSQIKKFLPIEKNISTLFGRKNSSSRQQNLLPPSMKLDSSNLKKLNEIENSPQRIGQYAPQGLMNLNKSDLKKSGSLNRGSGSFVDQMANSQQPQITQVSGSGQRPSSIKRMASNVMGMFNNHVPQKLGNMKTNETNDSIGNIPAADLQMENLPSSTNSLPPTKDGQRKVGSSFTQQQMRSQIVQQHQQQLQVQSTSATTNDYDKKGLMSTFLTNIKKTSSQKSGGTKKSGGPGSIGTSISDLEKIEKIMNEAQHAKKSVVKYFGQHFEEFRREMHYNKEIVLSDMLTQFGTGQEGFQSQTGL